METRAAGIVNATGRRLVGSVMRYGSVAPGLNEVFLPGALVWDDVILNMQHQRTRPLARTGGGGLVLEDAPTDVRMTAILPATRDGMDALELVSLGVLRGLSIEFRAIREKQDGPLRVIEKASLHGIGVVDRPAYVDALVERRERGTRVSGRVPTNQKLACGCRGPACDAVRFEKTAFDEPVNGKREILAVLGSYGKPIGSKRRGNLQLSIEDDGTLSVSVDVVGDVAEEVENIARSVPVLLRPFVDDDRSEWVMDGKTRIYQAAHLRAVIVGASDLDHGLPEADVEGRWLPWL